MPGSPSCASPRPARCGPSSWTSPGAATSGLRRRPSGPRRTRPARLWPGLPPERLWPGRRPPKLRPGRRPDPWPRPSSGCPPPAWSRRRCSAGGRSSCWPRCRPCSPASGSAAPGWWPCSVRPSSASAATRSGDLARQWNFALVRDSDGIHVRRGLTDLKSSSVPVHRLQAVSVRQPAFWRLTDWWRIEVNVAGVGSRRRRQRLGPAPRGHPGGGDARAHGAAAGRRQRPGARGDGR